MKNPVLLWESPNRSNSPQFVSRSIPLPSANSTPAYRHSPPTPSSAPSPRRGSTQTPAPARRDRASGIASRECRFHSHRKRARTRSRPADKRIAHGPYPVIRYCESPLGRDDSHNPAGYCSQPDSSRLPSRSSLCPRRFCAPFYARARQIDPHWLGASHSNNFLEGSVQLSPLHSPSAAGHAYRKPPPAPCLGVLVRDLKSSIVRKSLLHTEMSDSAAALRFEKISTSRRLPRTSGVRSWISEAAIDRIGRAPSIASPPACSAMKANGRVS